MNKIINFFAKNLWVIILILVVVASTLIKGAEVMNGNFPFTTDQGRDMVDIRHMVVTLSPRLVGPTTSINGVLLGPFWYYFNLIPFVIGGGDPSFIVYWQITWYQISVLALWFVLKRKSQSLASIISILLLLMPLGFNTARYFWNANSMPFFTIFYFAALILAVQNKSNRNLVMLGLISGLAMQIEAAFGIIFFPFAFLYFTVCHSRPDRESIKVKFIKILPLILGFFVTLLPQILFELKHGFIMTKILLAEMGGKGEMLGEKISFAERLVQRKEHFMQLVLQSSHLPPNYVPYLYLTGLVICVSIFIWFKKKSKTDESKFWLLSLSFVLFSAIFYLVFPQKLKIWYTLGLSVPMAIFLGSFLNFLLERKALALKAISMVFIGLTLYYALKSQIDYTTYVAFKPSNDRSNLKNELAAIDWVYESAKGKGFKVYSYLPSVYDFPYNHLFWWYGTQKYGYQPFETAYLPGQPEYIRDVDKLWTKKRSLDGDNLTFLIIEEDFDMPSRTQAWLGNFSKLCLVNELTFPWHAKVVMLNSCDK